MRTFEEFTEDLKREILNTSSDLSVEMKQVTKINRSYNGLFVFVGSLLTGPAINLDILYDKYIQKTSFDEIVKIAIESIDASSSKQSEMQELVGSIEDYRRIKPKLFLAVCNAENNKNVLSKLPHILIEDLAIICRIMIERAEGNIITSVVTNQMLMEFDVSKDKLFQDAQENSKIILPCDIEHKEGTAMVRISNSMGCLGASAIFYDGIPQMIAESLGDDFYILPSSIHEVIVVPKSKIPDGRLLLVMAYVYFINEEWVEPDNFLSNNVYLYDSEMKKIRIVTQ